MMGTLAPEVRSQNTWYEINEPSVSIRKKYPLEPRVYDRWSDPPRRIGRSARPRYVPAGVKFCHVNISRWGNPPSRGRFRDTSNSSKNHFGVGFASLLKVTIESHRTEGCSKSSKWVLKSINPPNTWFASILLVYVLNDHWIILRKCAPGWRGCKIACKGGLFFYPT